jgi:hypothetical protein
MKKVIALDYVTLEYDDQALKHRRIVNRFPDGSHLEAWPHPEDPHYHVIAHRLGYGDDLWAYCWEHEFCHSFVAEALGGKPSYVLTCLRYEIKLDRLRATQEEVLTQTFQRWLRANERPILAGVDWDGLKDQALKLLE